MKNSQTKCHHPGRCTSSQNTEDHTERKEEVQGTMQEGEDESVVLTPS